MKRIFAMILAFVICLPFAACGNSGVSNGSNNAIQNLFKQTDYPKMEEIEYYFVNGVSYDEPAALMGFTNNSKYTIVSMQLCFAIKENLTQEEIAVFETPVKEGNLTEEKIPTLSLEVYDYMVCDPGENVGQYKITLGTMKILERIISFLHVDIKKIHTVTLSFCPFVTTFAK